MKQRTLLGFAVVLGSLLLVGASCYNRGAVKPDGADVGGDSIKIATNERVGEYFTDSKGMALYIFTKDTADKSVCEGQCLAAWPVFYAEDLNIPSSLDKDDFGVTIRSDGSKQTTYMGWPVYYYIRDLKPGDIIGEGVGNVWFVVKKDYGLLFSTDATGNYLVDAKGDTLYLFTSDSKDKSVCEGQCLVNWPAYYSDDKNIPTTLVKGDFGEMTRADGTKQSTFKGWPLYYYIGDKARGDKNGQGLNNVWFVIDPVKLEPAK